MLSGNKVPRSGGDQVVVRISNFSSVQNTSQIELKAGRIGAVQPSVFDSVVPVRSITSGGMNTAIVIFDSPKASDVGSMWFVLSQDSGAACILTGCSSVYFSITVYDPNPLKLLSFSPSAFYAKGGNRTMFVDVSSFFDSASTTTLSFTINGVASNGSISFASANSAAGLD